MNGEEVEGRPRHTPTKPSQLLSVHTVDDLTEGEKIDLVMFHQSEVAKTVYKLMETIIITARDTAMACDTAETVKQKSLMDAAHNKAEFYHELHNYIRKAINEHRQKAKDAELQEALEDQEYVENVILATVTQQPVPKYKEPNSYLL